MTQFSYSSRWLKDAWNSWLSFCCHRSGISQVSMSPKRRGWGFNTCLNQLFSPFFFFFWQVTYFPVCYFTESSTHYFPWWKHPTRGCALPGVTTAVVARFSSCLRCMQCARFVSSPLWSKWLVNLCSMERGKKKVRTCLSPEKGFLIALAWHSNLVSSWPLIDFN